MKSDSIKHTLLLDFYSKTALFDEKFSQTFFNMVNNYYFCV